MVAQAEKAGGGGGGYDWPGYRVSFWGDENALELVVIDVQLCEYTKNHQLVHFKRVNFMVHELHLSK